MPKGGITWCNKAVDRICAYLGYAEFHGMMANGIIKHCQVSGDFSPLLITSATALAKAGRIVIAGQEGQVHGHVAIVYPGRDIYSGKWQVYVPQVANVGKSNGIMGVNYAFPAPPEFYILKEAAQRLGGAL